ncbi:MAG TPA: prolyl oligopeptidase family serine peptidase, partial [Acidimicrobiia bacterium]|nr:prolyl oligopeptidase family serine peptidase [Acidimicrobiia bacterium]
HWISDRTGWWNLYNQDGHLAPMDAEFAGPDWIFGQSTYTFLSDGRLVATWSEAGMARVGVVDGSGQVTPVTTPFTSLLSLQAGTGPEVVAIAASPTEAPAVVAIDVESGLRGANAMAPVRVLKPSRSTPPPVEALSTPRPVAYPSSGRTAHAFYYEPRLEGFEGPEGQRPPLIVRSHGGPTSAAQTALNLEIQFWTSRGFGVVDVDYGGSTGYGREYRRLLDGQWGIVDLDDCVNAARYLAGTGEVDPDRLVVRGGSAGGYTTLCALTFRDIFATGASYYGVADLETLARDTHKFESRYLDRLIGPYPERRDLYMERSPIHAAGGISAPVILLQGLEDKVVPPSQAEILVDALRANGVPFAYVTFQGEQHGFRSAAAITRAVSAELSFYGQVLGFEPAGGIEPVEIEHADRLRR